ncbi:channel protein (hemolysin III family) [Pseudonocardia autotrophica]|uniref:Hemolysin-III related n=1 Tax=Pseudonocardia autotrophica TaxID=2074 RepID=A0A1Y2N4G6_PSEAH|nr:Hemolysin-III related [Pseudonocardia autotrophica]TDN75875.1 channel protein (hemolysin III family) [Pseudonocardia autotrophica]
MSTSPAPLKPRMRGWLHLWSLVASVFACATLISLAGALVGAAAAAATAVYTLTTFGLFGISALYHRRTWSDPGRRRLMKRLDHSMIFLFIAGTYTPVSVLALPPDTATWVLTVVWGGALAGVALKLAWPSAPSWVGVPIYVALGWVAIFVLPGLLDGGGVAALVLLLAGGALYTAGAVVYALRRPDPWPATFGYHEIFHAATVLAWTCHHIAIWLVLLR